MNAAKNKITIFHDDLDRLNDGEFLNDTIIEFYLR
jgi:Ulp1 family protease